MKKLLTLAIVIAMTGCASAEQKEAERVAKIQKRVEAAATICEEIGYTWEHELFRDCVDRQYRLAEQQRRARNSAIGAALSGAGKHCSGGKTVGPMGVYVPNC